VAVPGASSVGPESGTVAALTEDGEGVVRGGKTVFVPGALPGEIVRFVRRRRRRQHDEGQLLEVVQASPQRVAARCAHFGVCGGCALQHLAPAAQLRAKDTQLRESLLRLAGVEPQQWLEPLTGPVWGYRRRARLGARFVPKKGRVVVGFRERAAPYVTDCLRCDILAPPVDALLEPLARLLTGLTIRERVPQIEVAVGDRQSVLVLRTLSAPAPADQAQLLAFQAEHGVQILLQPGGVDSLAPLAGAEQAEPLAYSLPLFDLSFEFRPTDFVQVNGPMNRELVTRAVELLAPTADERVLDLYCGLGNFTLALARRAREVHGLEGDPALIERARHNAARNRLGNVRFAAANLAGELAPQALGLLPHYDKVLLDPPRVGAREILPTVARLAPRRILYISCHAGSLARDVGILVREFGYALRLAGVLDMFPHTTHFESLVVLEPHAGAAA
jgi:23S rRNA (uracil1939-C5)-methyltransferase